MEKTDLQSLLKKYQAGQCSAEETVLLFAWLDRMAETHTGETLPAASKEEVYAAVMTHTQGSVRSRWSAIRVWMAAATLLPAVISLSFWQADKKNAPVVAWAKCSTGKAEIKSIRLPDGTTAWLGAASTLEYPQQFIGSERLVKITGQAFFDVHQDKAHPFAVSSGELKVQVLGTTFLVRNIAGQPARVAVASGKVRVTHDDTVLATLLPADELTYTHKHTVINKTDINAINAWTSGDMLIHNATLQQVLWELESFHDIRFSSRIDLNQGHLNLNFTSGMSLQNKLDIIATISVSPKVHFRATGSSGYEVY